MTNKKKAIFFLVPAVFIASLIAVYFVSPYMALSDLRNAIQANDPKKLDSIIDFESVRAGVKKDLASKGQGGPLASSLVDGFFSAQGFVRLRTMQGGIFKNGNLETPKSTKFISVDVFRVEFETSFIELEPSWTGWKVKRMRLKEFIK